VRSRGYESVDGGFVAIVGVSFEANLDMHFLLPLVTG
jgi:hypothetical protein